MQRLVAVVSVLVAVPSIVVLAGPSLLNAAPLVTFTNGQVADAVSVNANFSTLATRIDRNEGQPVGTVVTSMLTETQYRAIAGTGWILADGRSVAGSAYATLTGQSNAPDLRGVFLRGKNNGRGSGGNAGGDLALGAYQADAFGSHAHNLTGQVGSAAHNNGGYISGSTGNVGGVQNFSGLVTTAVGDTETRGRNVTVNHFLRID